MAATTTSIVYSSAAIVHISNGTSLAANIINPTSDTAVALTSTNLGRYPRADIALMISHTTSMSSASNVIALYRRDMNFDGTLDEPAPSTATNTLYKAKYMGVFVAQPQSATSNSHSSAMQITDVPLADQCEFYIENLTNASVLAGWTLKVMPKTDAAA